MATIVLAPLSQQGHVNPTFRIAKGLRAKGHRVFYSGMADLEDSVRREGFEFIPVLEELFPKGFQARVLEQLQELSGLRLYQFAREMDRLDDRLSEALLEGALDKIFVQARPDLLVCDVLQPEPPLVAHGHKVPYLLLNTTLSLRREEGLPPLTSPLVPDGRWWTGALIQLAWWRNTYRTRLGVWFRTRDVRRLLRLAQHYGFPPGQIDFTGSAMCPRGPELVLCPHKFAELGGPSSTHGQYLYAGPSVDLERKESAFRWERLQEGRPLVLAYLGTMSYRTEVDERLFRVILEAAARRPQWQFVLSVGDKLDPALFDGRAPNVIAVRHAPQVAMLRRATAMITHGGFNSVKECITLGVPMVVLPLQYDQPGISARVVHHGLGARAFAGRLTPESLLDMLDGVTQSPTCRSKLEAFRACFQEAEQEMPAADVIEQFMQRATSNSAISRT
jgi:zeaxanthin glucosyltransferase